MKQNKLLKEQNKAFEKVLKGNKDFKRIKAKFANELAWVEEELKKVNPIKPVWHSRYTQIKYNKTKEYY